MNEKNLIPAAHPLTVDEASKGGRASGTARRRKRDMKKCMEYLLALPVSSADAFQVLADLGVSFDTLPEDEINNMLAVNAALLKAALSGDVSAIKEMRNIIRDDERLKLEQARLKLEKERLKLEKDKAGAGDAAVLEKLDDVLSKVGE